MRDLFIVILVFLTPLIVSGQEKTCNVFVHSRLITENASMLGLHAKINQSIIKIDSNYTKVKTNYPLFDTLYYAKDTLSFDEYIITRLKPGDSYCFVISCCGNIDLMLAAQADRYMDLFKDYEKNFEILQKEFMQSVSISYKLISENSPDTIIAYFGDPSGFINAIILQKNKFSKFYASEQFFFWSNINSVSIGNLKSGQKLMFSESPRELTDFWIDKMEKMNSISFRFFYGEKIELTYFKVTNSIKVKTIK